MMPKKNWLEWSVFALGLALVGATLGYVTYHAITWQETPPDIRILLGKPEPQAGRFIIPVTVTNQGNQTAEAVRVEIRLIQGRTAAEESAELEFEFVPRHARCEGWISFHSDPATAQRLEAQVLSYQKP